MMSATRPAYLPDLAFLYLAVAYGADDYLSDAELGAIIEMLQRRWPEIGQTELQSIVAKALARQMDAGDVGEALDQAAEALEEELTLDEQEAVLADLRDVAEADGVVLHRERMLLHRLADRWEMDRPVLPSPGLDVEAHHEGTWSILHDLAFLYLVLAHSTDDELTVTEVQVILSKLQEWQPELSREQVQTVLDEAVDRYATGPDHEALRASVRALGELLPEEQRMAALNDLVQIANADGIFLDNEEDMINELMDAWEVAAFSSRGNEGTKDVNV